MKRTLAAIAGAIAITTAAAQAQSYPGDTGAGTQLGIQQVNNSGQVGTVTLFPHGDATRIVVSLKGAPAGRAQSVRFYRGPSCDDLGERPQYFLTDLRSGNASSIVRAAEDKLLSGNYNVLVFSSTSPGAQSTACGHLAQ